MYTLHSDTVLTFKPAKMVQNKTTILMMNLYPAYVLFTLTKLPSYIK